VSDQQLLRELYRATRSALIGIEVHNRMAKDCPGRTEDIDGPVINELRDAAHKARLHLGY